MREYINLGHMKEYSTLGQAHQQELFLPHHSVIKADSETTKLRVVFDGSARGTKGSSLNNALLVGPKVQDDLFAITARFRIHRYVFTGDMEKNVSTNKNNEITDSPSKDILERESGTTFKGFYIANGYLRHLLSLLLGHSNTHSARSG